MSLLDPERLLLILLPIALAVVYIAIQRRRTKFALRFSSVDLFDGVAPNRPGWRRHLAAAVYLSAIALLVVGIARPVLAVNVPATPTIMLAVDVSASMQATDVSPNRLAAAEAAATHFVDSVPAGTKIGLIAFADSARVVVAPTSDLDAVRNGIANLRLGQGTAIGDAIELGLEQLPRLVDVPGAGVTPSPSPTTEPVATSNQRSGAIVLLSDGATTSGRPNTEASAQAVAAGVPVTTIAFGTANGTVTIQGQTIPVPVDGNALQTIARTTGGQFYTAASADQVSAAFDTIAKNVGTTKENREVTDYLIGAALAAAVVAAGASLAWFSRLP